MSIFDLEDGDFIFGSGDTGFDSDGHMMSRMSDNMALDLDTGEIHMVYAPVSSRKHARHAPVSSNYFLMPKRAISVR